MLANMIHSAIDTLLATGANLFPDQSLKLSPPLTEVQQAEAEHKLHDYERLEAEKPGSIGIDAIDIARAATKGIKLVTHTQRVNKFVSDACSSRDGAAIATAMTLRKVSFTVARAEAKVNGKSGDASQPFAAAVCLIQAAEALRQLHSVVDTGWTLPDSVSGFKPKKFKFATATATKRPELTDKTVEAERKAQN